MMTGRPHIPRASQQALLATALLGLGLAACNPTVKVEAPDKPIVINLNVKIEQEVRIKVDKDVDNLVTSNPNIF
ncbi:YnbE family lipoprotein [Dongia rigui]|uniref:YnbE family lipoprotein n=1 Tax=Dongia rigui TaxID=940149 RepID=A0ABU5DV53_9PROT|nr:YnbE family lipoprotein [Dongia rigui]MDY0871165.1 YnbE family lipoprotein [Dongia rigui]